MLRLLIIFEHGGLAPDRPVKARQVRPVGLRKRGISKEVATVTVEALCSEMENPRIIPL